MCNLVADDFLAAAADLYPKILEASEEGEAIRRVPPGLVEELASSGMFQLYLPRSMGGPELPPLTGLLVIEALSRADGSIGWCSMIATGVSIFAGWLPLEVGRTIGGEPADFRVAGSLRPQGHARPVDGGYRVQGRWTFASGINHAKWLYCPCVLMDGEAPQQTPAGTPAIRAMWIPAEEATIADTWSVVGMQGTGSHDFQVDDAFVPMAYTSSFGEPPHESGPLYHPRMLLVNVWACTVGNALGIARGAIDALIALATDAASNGSAKFLRDRPLVQTRVAEAEAILGAARAYVMESVGNAWHAACAGESDLDDKVARARLAITHGIHEAVRAVDLVFHAAGTNAIYRGNALERYFRDIHVAVQHNSAYPAHYESAGKVFLGLRPNDMGW